MTKLLEPCLCGAPDCARCFPASCWHNENCLGDEECDCEDPGYDDGPEPYEPTPSELAYEADQAAAAYERNLRG